MKLFALFDDKLGQFNNPFVQPSRGAAQRAFQDEVNKADDRNFLNKYPEDYSLYQLGDFDEFTGEFVVAKPDLVCRASDVKI